MAGDWIKADHTLPDKREVIAMARALGVDRDLIAGKWLRVWAWASDNTENGRARSVTHIDIDETARMPGFAKAAADAGWLVFDDEGVTFPNFDRHNSKSAKSRALGLERQRERRSCVTEMSRLQRDKSVTREEKRREEEEIQNPPTPLPGGDPPTQAKPAKVKRLTVLNATATELPPIPLPLQAVPGFAARWGDWLEHLRAKGAKTTMLALTEHLTECARDPPTAIELIARTIQANWQSLQRDWIFKGHARDHPPQTRAIAPGAAAPKLTGPTTGGRLTG